MYFFQWLNSLDDLLYELMSWLVFFPLTLWRVITHPLRTMRYAQDQLLLEEKDQYSGSISPPIMMILAILLSQALDLTVDGTNPIISSKRGLAGLVNDNTTLLILRLFLFGSMTVIAAAWAVHRSGEPITRNTLKPSFYAQCYAIAPFALILGLAAVCLSHSVAAVRIFGAVAILATPITYGIIQVRWLKETLGVSTLRAFGDASVIMVLSLFVFSLISVLFLP